MGQENCCRVGMVLKLWDEVGLGKMTRIGWDRKIYGDGDNLFYHVYSSDCGPGNARMCCFATIHSRGM